MHKEMFLMWFLSTSRLEIKAFFSEDNKQMHREKSIECREHKIAVSSSSSDDDNNVSLGADQEKVPRAHASTHYVVSSSAVSQRTGGVPSQRDPYTQKYETQWKDDLSKFTNTEAA